MQQKWSSAAESSTASFTVGRALVCASTPHFLPHRMRSMVADCHAGASAHMALVFAHRVRCQSCSQAGRLSHSCVKCQGMFTACLLGP